MFVCLKKSGLAIFLCVIASVLAASAQNFKVSVNNYQLLQKASWSFEENKGQLLDDSVRFYGIQGAVSVHCTEKKLSFILKSTDSSAAYVSSIVGLLPVKPPFQKANMPPAIAYKACRMDMEFSGGNPHPVIIPADPQRMYKNYYTGDVNHGITGVHTFNEIIYKDIYPGIDMRLYTRNNGICYDFLVKPGGNPADIRLKWRGQTKIKANGEGGIVYSNEAGEMQEDKPYSFQGRQKTNIPSAFTLDETNSTVSFTISNYDKRDTLVIDPFIKWATFFGAGKGLHYDYEGNEPVGGLLLDSADNIYTGGSTNGTDNLSTSGAYQTTLKGTFDSYITKFDKSGNCLWATYYGGSGIEMSSNLELDSSYNVILSGLTSSTGLATSGAFMTAYKGTSSMADGFIAKFTSNGSLKWATYCSGNLPVSVTSMVTDKSNNIYILGYTEADSNIATSGSYKTVRSGGSDAVVMKFNSAGKRLWGTYYGGTKDEQTASISILDSTLITSGVTQSANGIATSGAYQASNNGGYDDAFIMEIDTSGKKLRWGTFFGGTSVDEISKIVIDTGKDIVMCGGAGSSNYITTKGAYDTKFSIGEGFLAKFSFSGKIKWATYYGGEKEDGIGCICVDKSNYIYTIGGTSSRHDIATAGAIQSTLIDTLGSAGFVSIFDANGQLMWGTYYPQEAIGSAIALGRNGILYVCGITDFTFKGTPGAYETTSAYTDNEYLAALCVLRARISGDTEVCKSTTVKYKTAIGQNYKYKWLVGGGTILSGQGTDSLIVKWNRTGVDTISAVIANASSCEDTVIQKVTVFAPPVPAINGPSTVCEDSDIVFSINSSSGDIIKWKLNGKILSQNTSKITISFDSAGTYKLLVIQTNVHGCTDSASNTISVIKGPDAKTAGIKRICAGDSVQIGAAAIPGHTYFWSSNSSAFTSTSSNPYVKPDSTTSYNLTETITATGCSRKNTAAVIVTPLPAVSVISGRKAKICYGDSILVGMSPVPGVTYAWTSRPAGFSSSASKTYVRPIINTTYILTARNKQGCTAYDSATVTIMSLPKVITGGNQAVCIGNKTHIGAPKMNGYIYSWTSIPAGYSSNLSEDSMVVSANVIYKLKVTDSATGCTNTDSVKLTVIPLPKANTGGNKAICFGDKIMIGANAVAGNSYQWYSRPAGFVSTTANPVVSPLTSTTYYLLEKNSSGCEKIDSVTITVNPAPVPFAGKNSTICFGDSILLGKGSDSGHLYQWASYPSGFTSSISNPRVSPRQTTTYYLTETLGNCSRRDSVTIAVNNPLAITGGDKSICEGQSIVIGTNAISGHSYSWSSVPSGFSSTLANPTVSPVVNTTYYLSESIGSCSKINSANITVNSKPHPKAGKDTAICFGDQATLKTNTLNGHKYYWYGPSGEIDSVAKISVHPLKTTVYYLKEVILATGCSNIDSITIHVNAIPSVKIKGITSICDTGAYLYVADNDSLSSYDWIVDKGSIISGQGKNQIMVQWSDTGQKTIMLKVKQDNCNSSSVLNVMVNKKPKAVLHFNDVCEGEEAVFQDSSVRAALYFWNFGDGENSSQRNPMHTFSHFGKYRITHQVTSAEGCVDSIADSIIIYALPKINWEIKQDTGRIFHFKNIYEKGDLYSWNISDGYKSDSTVFDHQFAQDSSYSVQLTAMNKKGCINTKDTVLTLKARIFNDSISVYPNPFMDQLNITLRLSKASVVYALLLDVVGKPLMPIMQLNGGAGLHTISLKDFNLKLASGIYIMQLKINDKVYLFKLLKI